MKQDFFKDVEDWILKNECEPFEDSLGNLCITVKSKYDSFGGEQEARLNEARDYGIDRLIRFYGKSYISEPLSTSLSQAQVSDKFEITIPQTINGPVAPTKLYDAASTPEYFISPRACVRMKVLVKISHDTFDKYTVNDASCDINKPAEGYLSAFISVENYERDIDYITTSMEDFLPKMAKADKYMTNINIVQEIKGLKRAKKVIRRYFNLNSVVPSAPVANLSDSGGAISEECEVDKQSNVMEIGFGYDYSPAFALIDGNKHTVGYDCFLESFRLNHSTTANYLIQLGNMSSALTKQLSLDFDIFQFLTQYTYPTPVVKTKENSLDGIEKYDSNGNLFSFANIAKLITLDLDKKSCKTDEQERRERFLDFDDATRANIASTVRQSKEFVGNFTPSESEGWQDLKDTGKGAFSYTFKEAIGKIYTDVVNKIDFNCVLEESLKCSLEAAITRLGEEALNDPDLSEFFNADGVIEVLVNCGPNDCDDQLQLKVGLPIFQGITIPANFPTLDYLSKAMDVALNKLYDVLINAIVSFITGIFELMCKAVSATDFAAIGSMFGDGFKSWLSKTIGVDSSMLGDGEAWADAVLSAGGEGFMGVVGNFVSKTAGSMDSNGNWVLGGSAAAVYSGTGVSLDLPNPNTGMVEEFFISPELLYQTMSGFKKATESLEANLTPEENNSIYKGSAPEVVVDVAHECLSISNPEMFESPEDVTYLFSALGKIVDGNFLEDSETIPTTITNACDLGDGSSQDILAANYLRDKDPLLSDSEIEELLSQEKNRLIEKVKKIHKILKSFQNGDLFPSFPSIFGSEDSLMPEPPPIIADAMKTAIEGLYGSTMNSFNAGATLYPALWEDIAWSFPSQVSANIKVSFPEPEDDNEAAGKIRYSIGYALDTEYLGEISETTTTKTKFGPYLYGKDFDSGYDPDNQGFWSLGEDDGEMQRFLRDYGEKMERWLWSDIDNPNANNDSHQGVEKIAWEVEDNDHTSGVHTSYPLIELESTDYQDYIKPDNIEIYIEVENSEDTGQFWVTHIEEERTGTTDVVRSPDFTDNIVTVESKTDGSIKGILYTNGDYTIGNNEATLGRIISTGMLKEHKIGTIDIINIDDLQDIQFEQLEILTETHEDSEIYKSIVDGMANSISSGKSSGSDLDALTFPTKDILGYSQITKESSELLSMLFPLSVSDDYCDKLSPLRRMGTISGLRLFIRTAIVESAMIAIQVFDVYGTDFIDDDVFVEIIKNKIKYNISRYKKSFDALDYNLFSDMKDTALKYNEIQILIGIDIEKIDSGSQALEEMIKTEASLIKENISSALELNWNYSSWDDFIVEKVFGEVEDINDAFDTNVIVTGFFKPSFRFLSRATVLDNKVIYSYELVKITRLVSETSAYGFSSTEGEDTIEVNTIISFECERDGDYIPVTAVSALSALKEKMLASKEYKTLFYETFPIKEIASSLVLYQESALSDDAVFYGDSELELNGRNLFDIFAETNLSTLQTFLACLNGEAETVYIDPFLEKLKT